MANQANRLSRIFLFSVLAAILSAPFAQARVVELRYDILEDNGSATAVCGFAVGERFGVQFTPPGYPAKLLNVRVLLLNVGLSLVECEPCLVASDIEMPLEIYHRTSDAPGTSLGSFNEILYSNDTVLNQVGLAASNLSIDEGSFLIAFTIQSNNASPAHDASNDPAGDMNFLFADIGLGSNWYNFTQLAGFGLNIRGDWVVRIDVEVPDEQPDGGPDAGGDGGAEGGDPGGDGSPGDPGSDPGPGDEHAGECTRDTDCDGGQVCDTDSGVCIQVSCSVDGDCAGGYLCRDSVCRKLCTGDGDCKGGESCTSSADVKLCLPIQEGDSCNCSHSSAATSGLFLFGLFFLLARRRNLDQRA